MNIGYNCMISSFVCISQEDMIIGGNVEIKEFISLKVIKRNYKSEIIIGGAGFVFKKFMSKHLE